MMQIRGRSLRRDEAIRYVGNMAQIGGTRHYELSEGASKGLRAIDVDTGSGFRFTILPDRGLDISHASYMGINLVYLSPCGEVNPAFFNPHGQEWLRAFTGGLLTTCGLTYFGPPCVDDGESLGLHGRYSGIPARNVSDRSGWMGDEYGIEIQGCIEESVLFGSKLGLTRRITTRLGAKCVKVHDTVENLGTVDAPFTILYHINAGFPLLDAHTRLHTTASKIIPMDEPSRTGLSDYASMGSPQGGYSEQNYHHIMKCDREGYARAAIINEHLLNGLGLYIRFSVESLPFLNAWKMLGETDYVLAAEPCNTRCESRAKLRESGELPYIRPREIREMEVEIGILDGRAEIETFLEA